jgi:serine/threonine-protein kinase
VEKAPDGYEIGSAYARDKTGVFYRAVQVALDRPVTIKALREDLLERPRARQVFEDERAVIASLEHPNLLLAIDTGEVDGVPYLVTESTAEPTLQEALKTGEPLAETRAVRIALGLARALLHLAEKQFVYKNLAPRNILLPRPATPKLVTFRHVKPIGEIAGFRWANVQSGAYCAPELMRDDLGPVTSKVNIYALGSLLYHMLAGTPPFVGSSAEARAAHAEGKLEPLNGRRPYLRDRAYAVVGNLMAHDPSRRADPDVAVGILEAYDADPLLRTPLKSRKRRKRKRR